MARRGFPFAILGVVTAVVAIVYVWLLHPEPSLHLGRPWALILLPGVGLAAWSALHLRRRRQGTMAFPRVADLKAVRPGLVGRLAPLPRALRIVALALLVAALARPQTSRPDPNVEVQGIDLALAVDLSNSMSERDLDPRLTRLDVAKQVISDFVSRRKTDRMALVVFGRDAYTLCPLTLDYHVLLEDIDDLHLAEPPSPQFPAGRSEIVDGQGTAIGNAIAVALNRVKRSDAKTKAIILVTDGNSNTGNFSPAQAARFAALYGVRVYTILVGRQDLQVGQQIVDPLTGEAAPFEPTDPKTLQDVAAITGGMPFLAQDAGDLQQRFQTILDDLDKSKLREAGVVPLELYPLFVLGAVLLVALEILLALTRFRKFP
jgi:Ca-activated chloride channel family protein